MIARCFYLKCDNDAYYVDDKGFYVCQFCMENDIVTKYTGQIQDDYEPLDWYRFPKNGYSE